MITMYSTSQNNYNMDTSFTNVYYDNEATERPVWSFVISVVVTWQWHYAVQGHSRSPLLV